MAENQQTAPISDQKDAPPAKRSYWNWIGLGLMALVLIPLFAFQHMRERTAGSSEGKTVQLDPNMDLQLILPANDWLGSVKYLDGTKIPCEGYGVAVITWDDYQQSQESFADVVKSATLAAGDFPAVAFFNATGFDSSGKPAALRRAKDGSSLYRRPDVHILRHAISHRDGSFETVALNGDVGQVSGDKWATDYMGLMPVPTAPEMPAAPPDAVPPQANGQADPPGSGLRGRVIAFMLPNETPSLVQSVPILVFIGKVDPDHLNEASAVRQAVSDDGGEFYIDLPAGIYTAVMKIQNRLLGNGPDPKDWPTVTVQSGWVDYDLTFKAGAPPTTTPKTIQTPQTLQQPQPLNQPQQQE